MNFTDPNRRLNGLTGFGVVNDVVSYDSRALNAMAEQEGYRGYNPVGVTIIGEFAGRNFSPYINYTVSDMNRRTAIDPRLQRLVGGFVSTQIHELGNSVSGILAGNINAFGDPNNRTDVDAGYQLELCVLNNLRGRGR